MYACMLRPRGEALCRADVFDYVARLKRSADEEVRMIVRGPFAALAADGPGALRPRIAQWRQLTAAGDVRLDNRDEVAAMARVNARDMEGDLQLVLAALDEVGEGCIPRILGDFSLVVWDAGAQKLLAVRDAFGVKPLYQRESNGLLLFASRVGPLQQEEAYDHEFLRNQLLGHSVPTQSTVWRGITSVKPGAIVRQRGTVRTEERYWRGEEFVPAEQGDEDANCFRFRELLEQAVRRRVEDADDVWAHLSGGLDSSSVVAIAKMMTGTGARLAGTVTLVDTLGEGDERVYSDAVVRRYGLRNEQVRDYWAWQDDGEPPPLTDHPAPMYPFYARDRRMLDVVRSAGGRVLLSGTGADHYLYGSLDYITDMASAWHVRSAIRELTSWSIATRQSFWGMSRKYLIDPFLPPGMQQEHAAQLPAWLTERMRTQGVRMQGVRMQARRAGSRFAHSINFAMDTLPTWLERFPGDETEVRYPFLDRPLVEWSLRLPVKQRIRPQQHKWILRQATRDVLPESVRTRTTKGGIDARIMWSLHREKARIDSLLKDPILAQLGCIEPELLRREVEQARRGVPVHNVHLFSALALETWLAVRHGCWASQSKHAATAA
jgi:asparagine synthase (glutamine-hydrolysing)